MYYIPGVGGGGAGLLPFFYATTMTTQHAAASGRGALELGSQCASSTGVFAVGSGSSIVYRYRSLLIKYFSFIRCT